MDALFLLDTNIVSEVVKDDEGRAATAMKSKGLELMVTSSIVASELRFGYRRKASAKLERQIEFFLEGLPILPFDDVASKDYASFRSTIESRGRSLGANDMLIAAHAIALDATLVSADVAFEGLDGLKLENWLR